MKQVTDHKGNIYRSLKEMCDHYGIRTDRYCNRRKAGWSLEETLTTPVRRNSRHNERVKDHKGNGYPSTVAMCKAYGINEGTYRRRRKHGASLEEALTSNIVRQAKKVQDHLGNWYPSINAMCKAYGITTSAYCRRKNAGKPLEECLTCPTRRIKTVTDHKGNTYPTIKDMCEAYGVHPATYYEQKKKGKSLEDILESGGKRKAPTHVPYERPKGLVTDHLGQTHASFEDMCQHHKVIPETCLNRLRRGLSLEEALAPSEGRKAIKDHLGNIYASTAELCHHYGIRYETFAQQLSRGKSVEEVLTGTNACEGLDGKTFANLKQLAQHYGLPYSTVQRARATLSKDEFLNYLRYPERGFGLSSVKDHEGNQYKNLGAMLEHYGIPKHVYDQRVGKLKWSLEKALTTPTRPRKMDITDHEGNVYKTIDEMANAYNINKGAYWGRIKMGWSLEKALTTPLKGRNK